MPARAPDQEIDRLYQLPLDEFTPARNALARTAGTDAARVRALSKPPIAAWAVNQLYWRNRKIWDALVAAAENARRAHKAVLAGRAGEIRSLSKVHDEAVETALKATLSILAGAGHPQTDATRQAIVTTLRALPGEEAPGRLTHTLQPGGFEALAGLSLGRGASPAAKAPAKPAGKTAAATAATDSAPRPRVDQKAVARARAAIETAEREVRGAEQTARREEFEVGKTTREEARAAKTVERATEGLTEAQTALDEAQAALAAAARQRAAAERCSRAAEDALAAARARAASEQRELERIEKG
jgi:hypothetical protein